MILRQAVECRSKILQLLIRGGNPHKAAIVLNHVDSGSPVLGVNHYLHGPIGFKDIAEGLQAETWVRKVMEHSGANYLVEGFS